MSTTTSDPSLGHVYVVDDDEECRTAVARLVSRFGYHVVAFASAEEFLVYPRAAKTKACAIIDNRMTGMSGMELQTKLAADGDGLPLIFLTGHAEVPLVVEAMRQGALTLLEKPVRSDKLRAAIEDAFAESSQSGFGEHQRTDPPAESLEKAKLIHLLSRREWEVANFVATGYSNKQIAAELGLSEKTIEKYRSNCVSKLRASSSAEMVRIIVTAEMMGMSP